jgi:hypothetical protein
VVGLQGGIGKIPTGQYLNMTFSGLRPLRVGGTYILALDSKGLIMGPNGIFPTVGGNVVVASGQGAVTIPVSGFSTYWVSIPVASASAATTRTTSVEWTTTST